MFKYRLLPKYTFGQNMRYFFRKIKTHLKLKLAVLLNSKSQEAYDELQAFLVHNYHRQRYNNEYPYFYHVKGVKQIAIQFAKVCNLTDEELRIVIRIALGHDFIEDVCLTYNDIKHELGREVADGIYACTDLRGHNRAERHGSDYFKELKSKRSNLGKYVKVCDILYNMNTGFKETQSGLKNDMFEKYVSEYPKLKNELHTGENERFDPIFKTIEQLIHISRG